jgi:crossover junction endodeoxyribonuclease RuvC
MYIPTSPFRKDLRLSKRRVLGIDPGLASTGWAVIDDKAGKLFYIDHGAIITKADCLRADRLFFIFQSIRAIIKKYKPGEAAIETLYFGKNVSSAIPVAEARGVVLTAAHGLILHELTPNAIKQSVTGTARAEKKQIQEMVRVILGLQEIPKPDHAADALGAAITAIYNQRPKDY